MHVTFSEYVSTYPRSLLDHLGTLLDQFGILLDHLGTHWDNLESNYDHLETHWFCLVWLGFDPSENTTTTRAPSGANNIEETQWPELEAASSSV